MDPCEAMWPKKQGFQHQQDPSNAVRDICWAMSNNASNALGNSQEMRPKVEDTRYGKNVEFSHLMCKIFRNSSKIRHVLARIRFSSVFHFPRGRAAEGCKKVQKKMQKGCRRMQKLYNYNLNLVICPGKRLHSKCAWDQSQESTHDPGSRIIQGLGLKQRIAAIGFLQFQMGPPMK